MAENPAPNAAVRPVVEYGPDPWGWSMVDALQRGISRALNGATYVGPRTGQWRGWTQPLQQFRGHAGLGAARVFAPKSSTMQEQNTTTSLAAAIFLDRAGS